MKIKLIPIGCKIPNLALMKISTYHKSINNIVGLNVKYPDKVIISSPFSFNKHLVKEEISKHKCEIELGGYGINKNKLSDKIEHLMPDYDLFNCDYNMGFTSRGCIRNCSFCNVQQMEGIIKDNSSVFEFHDKRFNKIKLLDNNFLASPNWESNLQYIIDHKLKVDINSGLDIRLINDNNASLLSKVKLKPVRFAFDNSNYKEDIINGIETLIKHGIKPYRMMVYVLTYPFEFEDAYERFKLLDSYKIDAFIMVYNNLKTDYKVRSFARWVNKRIHRKCSFKDYKYNYPDIIGADKW